jgi:hypothetical protein
MSNWTDIKKINIFLCSFTLAIIPILSPYAFFGPFSISHIFIFLSVSLTLIIYKRIKLIIPIFLLFTAHALLSTISYFSRINDLYVEEIFSNIIYTGINIFCIMQLIMGARREKFVNISMNIGIICSVFLLIQFALMMLNVNPPDGRIPGLTLGESKGWAEININNIYLRRLHSFFPEPSYYSIYLLPILALSLKEKKYKTALLFIITIFISTSSLGIISSVIILLIYLITNKKLKETLLLSSAILFIGLIWFYFGFGVENLLKYNSEKIMNLDENSSLRIYGYIEFYQLLPELQKIIGIGYNQLPMYFAEYNLKNYSNAFVLSLINFGFLGLLSLLIFIINKYLNLKKDNRIFIVIFTIICAVDAFLYNMYFFYILTFVFIMEKSKEDKL